MSWIYSGTLPSVEDRSRYTAPPEREEEHDEDLWDEEEEGGEP